MDQNDKAPRARRARFEDVARLEREVGSLKDMIEHHLTMREMRAPISKELFVAFAMLATIVSGGWQGARYTAQRAERLWVLYEKWLKAQQTEGSEQVEQPEPATAP